MEQQHHSGCSPMYHGILQLLHQGCWYTIATMGQYHGITYKLECFLKLVALSQTITLGRGKRGIISRADTLITFLGNTVFPFLGLCGLLF